MALARYWRIAIENKISVLETEISAVRFHDRDAVVDYGTATVSSNLTPIQGDLSYLLRPTPIDQEVVILPASKGFKFFLYDFKVAVEINAFRIGFGSSDHKSLTKLTLQYSVDGLKYTVYEKITQDLKLKFITPYTLSNLKSGNEVYPSLFHRTSKIDIYRQPFAIPFFQDTNKRRIYNHRKENFIAFYQDNIPNMCLPISGWMKTGKFYFEVETETVVNHPGGYGDTIYLAVGYRNNTDVFHINKRAIHFSLTGNYNGKNINDSPTESTTTSIGSYMPETYLRPVGGKRGFIGSFCLDLINKKISHRNSPWTTDFNYTYAESFFTEIATSSDVFFFLYALRGSAFVNTDLTFNFGQKPWKFEPPVGFDDRIGYRWELEVDTEWAARDVPQFSDSLPSPASLFKQPTAEDFFPPSNFDNYVTDITETYYIKGFIKEVNGTFKKKLVQLLSFPEMTLLKETVSSTVNGVYEFIDLQNRQYAVISNDLINKEYSSEIIAPIYPKLMEFDDGTP